MLLVCAKYTASEKNAIERMHLPASMRQGSRAWPHPVCHCLITLIRQRLHRNWGRRKGWSGWGWARWKRKDMRRTVCPKKGKQEVRVRTSAKQKMPSINFNHPFPRRRIPTVSPRGKRDPLPLLFIQECGTSWQAGFSLTAHSWEFPLWLFLSVTLVWGCLCVCFNCITSVISQAGLTQNEREC